MTLNQILVFVGVSVVLLISYFYAKHKRSTRGVRALSSALPLVFFLLATFCGINAFNMISDGRATVASRYTFDPHSYSSDSAYFRLLVALQIGATIFFLAIALKSWQRRHEA